MQVPIKRGMVIRHQNRVYFIDDFNERHTGQQRPVLHVQMRDVIDGRHIERTLDDLMPLQHVEYSYRPVKYEYHRGDEFVFMDLETYDEHELNEQQLGGFRPFLIEGQEFRVVLVEGRAVRLDAPEIVSLHVTTTAAPAHAVGSTGNVMKEATLENGLEVHVPLFIKNGDLIRVDTRTKVYAGKEKE
ncbi:Elongation factor P [Phycisphaerales bacterium]|nr:Elongation factor P [Phycisphaerales bacterium]